MKKEIKEYIIQIILIVFSVVLGLYLNEKIKERDDRKEAEKLFSIVKEELVRNRLLLLDWHPYHKEINDNLRDSLKSATFVQAFIKNRNSVYKLATRNTIMGQPPTADAWEMAKSNPVFMNIGYDKMFLLSKIYNQQSITFIPAEQMYELFNSTGLNETEHAQENLILLQGHFSELVGRQSALTKYYNQAFEEFQLEDKATE